MRGYLAGDDVGVLALRQGVCRCNPRAQIPLDHPEHDLVGLGVEG